MESVTTTSSDLIEHSWKRCHEYGFKPNSKANDQILTGNSLKSLLNEHKDLIAQTEIVFEKLYNFIQTSENIAVLVDPQGNIIYSVGNLQFKHEVQRVQLQVGANWDEKNKGTNAIGVALYNRVANRVHGREHFLTENHFLTCASSPIFSPTGDFLGVVNISGRSEQEHTPLLSLASLASDAIQNRLLFHQSEKEQVLMLKELEMACHFNPYPLFSIDQDRKIIRANQAAKRILGENCIGQEFHQDDNCKVETISQSSSNYKSIVFYPTKNSSRAKNSVIQYSFDDIYGSCSKIKEIKRLAHKAAQTEYPIFLYGGSGTGKELFAQSIHSVSSRSNKPFVAINCSAIPENLIESELFGYESGSFTGAHKNGKIGKFEAADQGTLFLDEIGDMSLRAQATLLRVLQEKRVTPVGSVTSKPIDVRIIAATHKDLLVEIKEGRFREDLFYRLRGIMLTLPTLAERSDIIELAEHFLSRTGYSNSLTREAKEKLTKYHWPGNIRELQSVLIQATFLADGEEIQAEHLTFLEQQEPISQDKKNAQPHSPSLKEIEAEAILKALEQSNYNITEASKILKIGRNTLYRKMKDLHIRH